MPSINELAIIILTLPLWLIANLFRPLLTLLLQKKSSNKLEKKVVPVSTIYWSGDGYNGECLSGGQLNLHTDKGIGIELFCSEGAMSMPDTSFIYEGRNLYRGNLTKYLYYIRDEQKGSVVCKALHSSIKIEIRVTPTNPIVP